MSQFEVMSSMSIEVVCPDCGRYIAPEGAVDAAVRCRCAEEAAALEAQRSVPMKEGKNCYICSKDLSGRTRLKDHLGRYWCHDCAKADERAKKRAAENLCPGCSRNFPPAKLFDYKGDRFCRGCYKLKLEETTKEIRQLGQTVARRRHDLKAIKGLLIALGVLGIVGILNYFFGPFF